MQVRFPGDFLTPVGNQYLWERVKSIREESWGFTAWMTGMYHVHRTRAGMPKRREWGRHGMQKGSTQVQKSTAASQKLESCKFGEL
jgi:hypothetical protein